MARPLRQVPPALITLAILALCSPLFSLRAAAQWSSPVNISTSAVDTEHVSIALGTSGRIHIVWTEGGEIWHSVHTGDEWSAPRYVTTGFSPQLVAGEDGTVHMVFVDRFYEIDDIYYLYWQPNTGWDLPVNVCETALNSSGPQLAIAPDCSYTVVWSESSVDGDQVHIARSDDGGWWTAAPIPNARGTRPVLGFTAAGSLWVAWQVWHDPGPGSDIVASQLVGTQWTTPVSVSGSPDVPSLFPSLVVWQDHVCLAWQHGGFGAEAVYVSTTAEDVWSAPEKRSGLHPAFSPNLALDPSGHVHLVWNTQDTVLYTHCTLTAADWQPPETIASDRQDICSPAVAAYDVPHVVWLAQASHHVRDVYYSSHESLQPTATASATNTSTASPTVSPPPSPTATPTLSPTSSPTPSPSPTPSSTTSPPPPSTPTSTVTRTAPAWRLFLPIIVSGHSATP